MTMTETLPEPSSSSAENLLDCLHAWQKIQPHALLFRFVDGRGKTLEHYTYQSFWRRTAGLAEELHRLGLRHGDRALLVYPAGLEIVAALFACARLGVISIPAPLALPGTAAVQRLKSLAQNCQPRALLTNSAHLDDAHAWQKTLPADIACCIATDQFQTRSEQEIFDPHELVLLQYTSGSTQYPKGVKITHKNIIHNARATLDHVPIGVSWLPQFHDMGLIGYYLFPVVVGGANHGFSSSDFLRHPALWLKMISEVRATYTSSPNFGFKHCLRPGAIQSTDLSGVDLSSLRVLMNAAEPVQFQTSQDFLTRFSAQNLNPDALVAAYGLAEATLALTHHGRGSLPLDPDALGRHQARIVIKNLDPDRAPIDIANCGSPLKGVTLRIVDVQTQKVLPEGCIGEIWAAGPNISPGYWQKTDESTFGCSDADHTLDPIFLRTGDLGFLHQSHLYICGRHKDLIIKRGVNLYPQDLEACIADASDLVRETGVAAFQDLRTDALIVIVEVKQRSRLPNAESLAQTLHHHCGLQPDVIVLAPAHSVVRTSSGKISRQPTAQKFFAGEIDCLARWTAPVSTQPPSETESMHHRDAWRHRLAAFEQKLNAHSENRLGDLGLDSLKLTELQLDLEHALQSLDAWHLAEQLDGPLLQHWRCGDLAELLHHLDANDATAAIAGFQRLLSTRQNFAQTVQQRMKQDAFFQPDARLDVNSDFSRMKEEAIFLTGATGFFGPFLLASLLQQTQSQIYILTRARDEAHGRERIGEAMTRSSLWNPSLDRELSNRIHIVCGDLEKPYLGLPASQWQDLTQKIDTVFHNAACVNYVLNYDTMAPTNVLGIRTLLNFSLSAGRKRFHLISSTFIFGWTAKGVLLESDNNDEMNALNFGYAQSKWVAEQLALHAHREHGLDLRIYRPSLISVAENGAGDRNDVAVRLLAFMIQHQIAVDTPNQLSLLPADVTADNIVAIACQPKLTPDSHTFHITADGYYSLTDLTKEISRSFGYRFRYYDIPGFIEQLNLRCQRRDPVYPLLDFFNRSALPIAAMRLKRYSNDHYQEARNRTSTGRADPGVEAIAARLVGYLKTQGWA